MFQSSKQENILMISRISPLLTWPLRMLHAMWGVIVCRQCETLPCGILVRGWGSFVYHFEPALVHWLFPPAIDLLLNTHYPWWASVYHCWPAERNGTEGDLKWLDALLTPDYWWSKSDGQGRVGSKWSGDNRLLTKLTTTGAARFDSASNGWPMTWSGNSEKKIVSSYDLLISCPPTKSKIFKPQVLFWNTNTHLVIMYNCNSLELWRYKVTLQAIKRWNNEC